MQLTEEQTQKLTTWVQAGIGLSEIQTKIREEFGLIMTFMDVRFLVDDLDLELKDAPSKVQKTPPAKTPPVDKTPADAGELEAEDLEPMNFGGAVSVEVDAVQRPGVLVGGSVTFSDGVKATWQLDQMGRLGIVPPSEGYRPSEEDMLAFQEQLQLALQQKGF